MNLSRVLYPQHWIDDDDMVISIGVTGVGRHKRQKAIVRRELNVERNALDIAMEIELLVTWLAVDEDAEIGRWWRVLARPVRIVVLRVFQVCKHTAKRIDLARLLLTNGSQVERDSYARMNANPPQPTTRHPFCDNRIRF